MRHCVVIGEREHSADFIKLKPITANSFSFEESNSCRLGTG